MSSEESKSASESVFGENSNVSSFEDSELHVLELRCNSFSVWSSLFSSSDSLDD